MKAVELDIETGDARLTFGGTTYVVRAPLLGEMRELDVLADKIEREAATAEAERVAAAALADDAEVDEATSAALSSAALSSRVAEVLPWWRRYFELCSDQPLPDDDLCPLWMGTVVMVSRLQTHWTLAPFVALGPAVPREPSTGIPSS